MAAPAGERDGCVLALDIGSSSVRAGLFGLDGRPLAAEPPIRIRYAWRHVPAGAMEVEPERLFAAVVDVLDRAVAAAERADTPVRAVGSAAFWHSLMGIDASGVPVTPVYGWGDSRAAGAARELAERGGEAGIHERTGCFVHPGYPLARLLWLRERGDDTFSRAAAWLSFPEYVELRLMGVRRCSLSMASGTGLLNLARGEWDARLLERLGLPEEALSPLVDTDAPSPGLRFPWTRRWPSLAGAEWIPPLGDGACANVGSGASRRGSMAVTIGTSAALRTLVSPPPEPPPTLWCYRLDRDRAVLGRALSTGGNAMAFLRGGLRLPSPDRTEAALAAMAPDAHGLTILPELLADRGPAWDGSPGSAVLGVGAATRPLEIVQAWMEAIVHRLAAAHEALEHAVGPVAEVIASGGALAASPTWTRMLADALGRSVLRPGHGEATLRGAALVALERLGTVPRLETLPTPEGELFAPDPARTRIYRRARERQQRAEAILREGARST